MIKRALVIIDLINDYLDRWDTNRAARLVSNANKLANAFRWLGLPVIWVRQEFRPDLSDAFLEMRDNDIKIAPPC
ncbi:isochorismatase family protein [Sinorhizobium meliloti]|nr:isochorismatase family protein [Sinorhizobium meliloti]RVN79477.1 isochorismatase family protein [Sinorhizobium meliloti]RVN99660.1 isochorismatase family protein [Sinorhizobium meliloti]